MNQSATDNELICSIANDDRDAFDMLYNRHWAGLYTFAYFILKDKEACKDIIQDVFIWIWEHRKGLEIKTPHSYLKTAVKYKIANYIRAGNIRNSFFEEAARFNYDTSFPGANELSELKELKNIIRITVSNIPLKCREIFLLSREGNFTNRDIAGKLEISVKTVENQITIALHRIGRIVSRI